MKKQETVKLRRYQDECINGLREAFATGNNKCLAVLPTGSGKTTIFGKIIQSYLDRNPGKRAAILSHLGLLTAQTGDRLRDEWGVSSGVLQADRYPSRGDRCVISTIQSFRKPDKLQRWSRIDGSMCGSIERLGIGLLIIDEAHRMGSVSYDEAIEMFPNALVIGFTATPFRQNKLMSNMFDCVAYTVSMQQLIDQEYLVPPELKEFPFSPDDEIQLFAELIQIYKRNHEGEKAVFYLRTIEQCNKLRAAMLEAGINASCITSEFKGEARDKALRDFKNGGGADVLITVDVLTAGFDSPNLKAIFQPFKVGSLTTYLQRVGRGLRPYKGKTSCMVYVGSESPGIEPGFWEKINKEMLNAGNSKGYDDVDNLVDVLELDRNSVGGEKYDWTKEVVKMARDVQERGMGTLFDMIVSKQFPEQLLDQFVASRPAKGNLKGEATAKQLNAIRRMGYNVAPGLSKSEASAIILAHNMSKGRVKPHEIVPEGVHKGKHFSQVPRVYWRYVGKQTSLYQSYINWINGMKK